MAATTADELARLAPQVTTTVRAEVERADPTLDDDLRTWNDPHCDLPKLRLLGPVSVRLAPTGRPKAAVGRKPFLTGLVAYLATHPNGATTQDVAAAMNIDTDRVRKDIQVARTWLGVNPRTGRLHIPDSRQTAAAKTRGRPAYQIEGLLVDADLFRRLRLRGQARGREGLTDLQQALALVTGTPFDQLRDTGRAWLAEGDRLDQILLCSVIDVAHLVSVAALEQGDIEQARSAAELALRVAPDEESARLDLAAALHAQGHHHAAEQLLRSHVYYRSDDDDGVPNDLPPRTERIVRRWHTGPRAKATA